MILDSFFFASSVENTKRTIDIDERKKLGKMRKKRKKKLFSVSGIDWNDSRFKSYAAIE